MGAKSYVYRSWVGGKEGKCEAELAMDWCANGWPYMGEGT